MTKASAGPAQNAACFCPVGTMQRNESGAIWIRVSSKHYSMPEFVKWNALNVERGVCALGCATVSIQTAHGALDHWIMPRECTTVKGAQRLLRLTWNEVWVMAQTVRRSLSRKEVRPIHYAKWTRKHSAKGTPK